MNRQGLTLIEVMIAVALASFIAGIGFTGIVAFGRSITRAKQFVSETELITAAIRMGIASADTPSTPTPNIDPIPTIHVPKNWVTCAISTNGAGSTAESLLTFTIPDMANLNKATTGNVSGTATTSGGLNMYGTSNTLTLRVLPCLP